MHRAQKLHGYALQSGIVKYNMMEIMVDMF